MGMLKKWTINSGGYIFLIAIVAALVCKVTLFKSGVLIVNDVDFHYARAMSTIHALMDHQIVPQLDPTAVNGFGYSWNQFYGPLPTYFIAAVFFVTKNIGFSVNLVSFIAVFLIGWMMFRYINYRTQSKASALVASLMMMTSTSVLVNLYLFTGYGSLFALFFAIMALYGIQIILDEEQNFRGIMMLAVGGSGMLLSHSLTCFIMLVYIVLLLLWQVKSSFKKIKPFILAALLSFGLSAYFLLPFVELKRFNLYNQFNENFLHVFMWKNPGALNSSRLPFDKMLFPEDFGVTNFPTVLLFISLILCIGLLIKTKSNQQEKRLKNSQIIIFLLFGFSIFVLCSTWIDWKKMPSIFWTMQYTTRIVFYVSGIAFSIFIGLAYSRLTEVMPKVLTLVTTVILVGISLGLGQASIYSKHNIYTVNYNRLAGVDSNFSINGQERLKTAIGEFFPTAIGTQDKSLTAIIMEAKHAFWFSNEYIYPNLEKRKVKGYLDVDTKKQATIDNLTTSKFRSQITFDVKKTSKITRIELPKIYYPGYKAYSSLNSKKEKLLVQPSKNGYVQINLPKGTSGKIVTYYGLSRATVIGLLITGITIIMIIVWTLKQTYRRKKTV